MGLVALQHVEDTWGKNPGIEPMSPAFTGRFLSTVLPRKSFPCIFVLGVREKSALGILFEWLVSCFNTLIESEKKNLS